MNPKSLRVQAARELERAQYHTKRAAFLERTADELEKLEAPLTAGDKTRIKTHMPETAPVSRRVGRPNTSSHPFPVALDEHGTSIAGWAEGHGIGRTVVRSWFADGVAARRIPRVFAEMIEREFGIPASQSVWKNGIRQ